MSELPFRARAFGQDWAADLPLSHFDAVVGNGASSAAQGSAATATSFTVRQIAQLPERTVLARKARGEICDDGVRFGWANVATFDVKDGRQIDYFPHGGWHGALPDTFFSTVTALAMAGIGMLPFHASAVELDGRAFLFAGKAGTGKSTITAELLSHGAHLLSDDLSVLCPPEGEMGFRVTRGRAAVRLHPATAALVDAVLDARVPDDARGKLLIRPHARAADRTFPLAGIFLLGDGPANVPLAEAVRQLPPHLFRPRWLSAMLGHGQRRAALIALASAVPVRHLPAVKGFDAEARRLRIQSALSAMAG